MAFDPYYTWLGIRPEETAGGTPNHYRLLGLALFEDNAAVIDNAADRQMSHVRTFQTGPHAAASQRLLGEITLARICLVNPQKRAAYDAALRTKLSPAPVQPSLAETQPIVVEVPFVAAEAELTGAPIVDRATTNSSVPLRKQKNPAVEVAKIVAGGIAGLLISVLLLRYVALIDITGLLPLPKKTDSREVAQGPDRTGTSVASEQPAAEISEHSSGAQATPPDSEPNDSIPSLATNSSANESPEAWESNSAKPGKKKKGKKQAPPASEVPNPSPPPIPGESTQSKSPTESPMVSARTSVLLAKRQPAPNTAEQAAIKQTLEELYGISRLKTDAEKLKVAGDLRAFASGAKDKPAEQFIALRQAAELARDVGDAKLLAECIDALALRFEIDLLQVEATMLAECAKNTRAAEQVEALVLAARPVVLFAVADEEFEVAKRLTDATMTACNRTGGAASRKSVSDGQKEINRRLAAWQVYQQALKTIQVRPDDAAANLAAGKWLSSQRGDWPAALPYLRRAGNPRLQKAAELEFARSSDTLALLDSADAWYEAGTGPPEEPLWLVRAERAYQQLNQQPLDGLPKAKVERRLGELQQNSQVQSLIEERRQPAAVGQLHPEIAPIVRRHCVLAFSFEADDFFSAADKPMVRDHSGRANHGAVIGAQKAIGQAGAALDFNGRDNLVECPDNPSLNPTGAMTIVAWARPDSWRNPNDVHDYVVGKDDWAQGARGFTLRFGHGGELDATIGHGSNWLSVVTKERQPLHEWIHVAAVYDGRNLVTLVNAVELATQPLDRPIAPSPFPLMVGGGPYGRDRRFQGQIDEVALFDTALTADDIRVLYELGKAGTRLCK